MSDDVLCDGHMYIRVVEGVDEMSAILLKRFAENLHDGYHETENGNHARPKIDEPAPDRPSDCLCGRSNARMHHVGHYCLAGQPRQQVRLINKYQRTHPNQSDRTRERSVCLGHGH